MFPSNQEEFKVFEERFYHWASGAYKDILGIPDLALKLLDEQYQQYLVYQNNLDLGEDTSKAIYEMRDYQRTLVEDNMRNIINQFIKSNPAATPEMLVNLGLNVPDTIRTPINMSTEPPVIKSIKNVGNHSHEIIIWGTAEHRAKVKGCEGYEIRCHIGSEVPKSESEFEEVAKISRERTILHYSAADFSKVVHYIVCAYGNKGQHSDWTEVVTRVID
jgi:hypothetical protein